MLKENRKLRYVVLFCGLTFGVYWFFYMYHLIEDLYTACGYVEEDGEDDGANCGFFIFLVFNWLTLGLYGTIWEYCQFGRIQNAGARYGIEIQEGKLHFILLRLIPVFGVLITEYMLVHNLNRLCHCYNRRGQIRRNQPGAINPPKKPNSPSNFQTPPPAQAAPVTPPPVVQVPQQQPPFKSVTSTSPYSVIDPDSTHRVQKGKIRGLEGEYKGAEIIIESDQALVIGRNGEVCKLILSDEDISRKHCTIRFDAAENAYFVQDHSSLGTYLNGNIRLEKEKMTRCPIGSKLTLGKGRNQFLLSA